MKTVGATEEQFKNRQKKYKKPSRKEAEKRTAEAQENNPEVEPGVLAE